MSKSQNTKAAETPVVNIQTPVVNSPENSDKPADTTKDVVDVPRETPEPIVPAKPSLDDLRKAAAEAAQKSATAIMDENLTDAQRLEISLNAYKAAKAVQDRINEDKKAEADKLAEEARNARAAIYDDAIKSYDAFLAAKSVYDASQKSESDRATFDAVYAEYKSKADAVRDALKNGIVKKELHVAMGTTGKQLEKSTAGSGEPSANDILMERMAAGATNAELIAEGYKDGTVRTARWKYNQKIKAGK